MLGIGKLIAGAEDYYLRVAQGIEDYYVGVSAPGRWIGSTQQLLGLDGEVEPDALRAVFAGLHPATNNPLLTSANRTVVAFDLTFKAGKTVSLLHALAPPDVSTAVEAAHERAVRASLRYLERHAVHTRRGRNGIDTLDGDGLVAASFRHYRNRNDEPHLHEHVLVPNMVPAGGRWSTLDARDLYQHAKTAGYIYQAELRDQLTHTLGLRFGPVTNGVAPIDGIHRGVVEAFSTRRAEILEHLDTIGASSARAAQIAALQTRRAKDLTVDVETIETQWRARAREHGLEPDRLTELVGRVGRSPLSDTERADATTRMLCPTGLTAHASSFDRRDVIRAWCDAHPQGASLDTIEHLTARTINQQPDVVALRAQRWSTKDLLACEQSILDAATAGIGRGIATTPASTINAAIAHQPTATTEQQAVARSLTSDGDALSVLIAPAGAGKGFTLGIANRAWPTPASPCSAQRSPHAPPRSSTPVPASTQ